MLAIVHSRCWHVLCSWKNITVLNQSIEISVGVNSISVCLFFEAYWYHMMSSFLFQLHELQDRNAECLGMLHESQEELKLLRSRASSVACLCHSQSCGAFPVVINTASMAYTYWHIRPVAAYNCMSKTAMTGAAAGTTL